MAWCLIKHNDFALPSPLQQQQQQHQQQYYGEGEM
jgi:hypothetical protein